MVSTKSFLGSMSAASMACFVKESVALPSALHSLLEEVQNPRERGCHGQDGISGVSVEGAAGNIAAEAPGWDFDGARAAAHAAWRGSSFTSSMSRKQVHESSA